MMIDGNIDKKQAITLTCHLQAFHFPLSVKLCARYMPRRHMPSTGDGESKQIYVESDKTAKWMDPTIIVSIKLNFQKT